MVKYINADRLIKQLNSTIAMLEREMQGYPFVDGMRRGDEVVRDAVMKMPLANVRKSDWIRVLDGFPIESCCVYITVHIVNPVTGEEEDIAFPSFYDANRGTFVRDPIENQRVTAWMPLPEPFKPQR